MKENSGQDYDPTCSEKEGLTLKPQSLPSAVLERLIEEVRNEDCSPESSAYNRFHNRHNRGR